jgi:hypothetical protein
LKAGDTMKLGIEGLGEQNQTCFQGWFILKKLL